MRKATSLYLAVFYAAIAGCGNVEPPQFGAPRAIDVPAGPATGPRLTAGPEGALALSWIATTDEGPVLRFAPLYGSNLAAPMDVAAVPRMFVNWADLPSVMQVDGDHWFAHWLRYSADKTYSYDVVVAQSFDGGDTWSEALPAHTDGTPTEHGFVSMYRTPDGTSLLWLDGRNTPEGPMTLRSAVITPKGERVNESLVDESVCDCCQTDVAVSASGPIAVYRDRTADEIRDIYITRYANDSWEPGTRLYEDNWKIAGCPVNGPSIIADGNRVAVAWFSAARNAPTVRVVISKDGGRNFGSPVEIDTGRLAGYVDTAFIDDNNLAVSWVGRGESGSNVLRLRTISFDGQPGDVHDIAEISQLRVFPQLGFQDGALYLFWTDTIDESRRLHGVRVPVS